LLTLVLDWNQNDDRHLDNGRLVLRGACGALAYLIAAAIANVVPQKQGK
jgi:hypothetical protein